MTLVPEPDHQYLKCITNSKQICDHPVNNSPTKQQWSFPHQERIPKPPRYSLNPVGFHDINPKLLRSNFAVGIGKGKKWDVPIGEKCIPGPNTYYPLNLAIGFTKKRGYSFGLSREKVPQPVIGEVMKNSAKLPGPGTYTPALWKTGRSVSFKIKLNYEFDKNNPVGPGQYSIPQFMETQKRSQLSNVKGVKSPKYPPPKSDSDHGSLRRPNSENIRYPPFTCDVKYQINPKGVFFNSKYMNTGCKIFDKEARLKPLKPQQQPGPGNYLIPSDFGIYQSSKAK